MISASLSDERKRGRGDAGRAGGRARGATQVRGGITAATATGRSVGRPGKSDRGARRRRELGNITLESLSRKGARPPDSAPASRSTNTTERLPDGRTTRSDGQLNFPSLNIQELAVAPSCAAAEKAEESGEGAKRGEESSERAGGVGPSRCHGRRLPRCILSCRGRGAEAAAAAWVSIKLLEARYASPSLPLHRSLVSSTNDIRRQRRKRGAK